jgi:hypothetical protein
VRCTRGRHREWLQAASTHLFSPRHNRTPLEFIASTLFADPAVTSHALWRTVVFGMRPDDFQDRESPVEIEGRQKRVLKSLSQSSNLIKSLRVSVTFAVMPAGAPL